MSNNAICFVVIPELADFLTCLASIPLFIGLRSFRPYHQIDKAFKALNPLNQRALCDSSSTNRRDQVIVLKG